MIYILAGTYDHARKWAASQSLNSDEWFTTLDEYELNGYQNFHVIVLESAAELPSSFFERIFRIAQIRGRMGQ